MRVLIVEDTNDLAEAVSAGIRRAGFACDLAATAAAARYSLAVQGYDAVVLDIGLPDGDGRAILREMRRRGDRTPVLMLTAELEIDARVGALNEGADDYLVKPFDQRELEARLHVLLRRENGRAESRIVLAQLEFDPAGQSLRVAGEPVHATRRELSLLHLLLAQRGQIVSKERLFDGLFSFERADVGDNAVEVYVARLRKKLAGSGVRIETHRGLGYRLDAAHV